MEVLVCLSHQDGNVVSKEKLIAEVWTDTFVGDDALVRCISDLRRALEDDPKAPRLIETVPKRGYRVLVKTQAVNGSHHGRKLQLQWIAALGLLATGLVALGYWYWSYSHRPPKITKSDTIVLADFVNTTGDSVFDDTLKQGLSVQLSQSPFLNLLSDHKAREILTLMGHAPGERLTPELTREICVRSQSKVMLAGSISGLGSQYVVGVRAMNCNSGEVFAQEQEQAAAKEEVLKVLSQETTKLRRKLGESLSSIKKYDVPLDQVTTSSLDALKAFSTASYVCFEGGDGAAVPFLRRATELDPNFAMAHALLGIVYANLEETNLSMESMTKAYGLRSRVSEKERLYIESRFYHVVTRELDKADQVYELLARTYPESGDLVNLAASYGNVGQYDKGVTKALDALQINPGNHAAYSNLVGSYVNLNRIDDAKATYRKMTESQVDYPDAHYSLYTIVAAEGDAPEMRRHLAAARRGLKEKLESKTFILPSSLTPRPSTDALARRANSPAARANRLNVLGKEKPQSCGE